MAHLGARAFEEIGGEVVQTTSFVMLNRDIENYKGVYCRLIDPTTQKDKEDLFLSGDGRFESSQSNFSKIPGSPVAYWASEQILNDFTDGKFIGDDANVKIGMGTGKNDIFLREWWEVFYSKIDFSLTKINDLEKSNGRYFPYNKGGDFRRWYGNLQEVLWFDKAGRKYMNTMSGHRENGGHDFYCKEGLTWSFISSSKFGIRYMPTGCFFDVAGSTLFSKTDNKYTLGFLASKVCFTILQLLNPTLNYQAGNIKSLPLIYKNVSVVDALVDDCIRMSKSDWDTFENSWDFLKHPLLYNTSTVKEAFIQWKNESETRFNLLKANEEELNRIFIDIYGLQEELTPEEEDKDVTVRKADLGRDIRSFVSYAVGCMMGRYSLDVNGLAYAGGDWDDAKYKTFIPDKDAILPITDDEYFTDDIVGRFVEFVRTVYGADTLEENLKFIADALDEKGSTSREVIRNYFLNSFYKDHLKTYQKRPIYWLFDSGKKNGFKCLVYMHRYRPDTIARIRTDYVHEQQARYRTAIEGLERQLTDASTSERVKINKQLTKLKDQAEETRIFEEKIHHLADQMIKMDLDDGVKHNYEIFKDVLAKIK